MYYNRLTAEDFVDFMVHILLVSHFVE